MIEIFAKGFHGVQIVFTEGEGSRGGGGPGVDQSHLHDVKTLRSRTKERAAVGDVDVYFGTLVEVLRVVGIAFAHDRGGDDGVNLNGCHAGTAVRHGAQHVNSAAGPDDGKLAARPQHIGQSRRSRHQIAFPFRIMPVLQVGIHDVSGSVGVNHDGLSLALAVYFHA